MTYSKQLQIFVFNETLQQHNRYQQSEKRRITKIIRIAIRNQILNLQL